MNNFIPRSSQIITDGKWVSCGVLFINNGDNIEIQEVELDPKYRFDTKEEADTFFRTHFISMGYQEKVDVI